MSHTLAMIIVAALNLCVAVMALLCARKFNRAKTTWESFARSLQRYEEGDN